MTHRDYDLTIFLIATGKYFRYAKLLITQINEYVNPGSNIQILLLTDSRDALQTPDARLQITQKLIAQQPWPEITLFRYETILKFKEFIMGKNVFWIDADMSIVKEIDTNLLFSKGGVFLAKHPGFTFNGRKIGELARLNFIRFLRVLLHKKILQLLSDLGWETSKKSKAFVPLFKRRCYRMGGFWGGDRVQVLEMCEVLAHNVREDYKRSLVAVWNDESHLNWFAANYFTQLIPNGFVGVEDYELLEPSIAHIFCLDKSELDATLDALIDESCPSFLINPKDNQIIRVDKIDIGFHHQFNGGNLIWNEPTSDAPSIVTQDLPLFFYQYTPRFGDVIFDIGAGVGSELLAFSNLVGPKGLLYCVEPDPLAFARLNQLRQFLDLKNVILLNYAVSNFNGSTILSQTGGVGATNSTINCKSGIQIECKTFDAICKEFNINKIDYVKVNVEGSEVQVLEGLSASIEVRNWCISCHDFLEGESFKTKSRITQLLMDRKYKVVSHPLDEKYEFKNFYVYAK